MLGTRFKRLGEQFLSEVTTIYKTLGIDFEPAWFPLFYLLNREGETTVSEIADRLRITPSAASQQVRMLREKGYLEDTVGLEDKRVRIVRFTPEGRELQDRIAPVWTALAGSMEELLKRGESSALLLEALNQMEELMGETSLSASVLRSLEQKEGKHNG